MQDSTIDFPHFEILIITSSIHFTGIIRHYTILWIAKCIFLTWIIIGQTFNVIDNIFVQALAANFDFINQASFILAETVLCQWYFG